MPDKPADAESLIPRWRVVLVHLTVALISAGSTYAIVMDRELWPFSPYPMFSKSSPPRSHLQQLRVYGLVDGPGNVEIPLYRREYIRPYDSSRLITTLRRLRRRPNAQQDLRRFLRNCLERYEDLRASGRHDGPPLRAIRLYDVVWEVDPWARNHDAPVHRERLVHVRKGH